MICGFWRFPFGSPGSPADPQSADDRYTRFDHIPIIWQVVHIWSEEDNFRSVFWRKNNNNLMYVEGKLRRRRANFLLFASKIMKIWDLQSLSDLRYFLFTYQNQGFGLKKSDFF